MSATLERPRYTILGGPNGAGKSTTFARLTEWGYRSGAFLNPDEIAKALDVPESAQAMAAGREALRRSRTWMAGRRSFVRESTLSSREIVRSAQAAKDAGYRLTFNDDPFGNVLCPWTIPTTMLIESIRMRPIWA